MSLVFKIEKWCEAIGKKIDAGVSVEELVDMLGYIRPLFDKGEDGVAVTVLAGPRLGMSSLGLFLRIALFLVKDRVNVSEVSWLQCKACQRGNIAACGEAPCAFTLIMSLMLKVWTCTAVVDTGYAPHYTIKSLADLLHFLRADAVSDDDHLRSVAELHDVCRNCVDLVNYHDSVADVPDIPFHSMDEVTVLITFTDYRPSGKAVPYDEVAVLSDVRSLCVQRSKRLKPIIAHILSVEDLAKAVADAKARGKPWVWHHVSHGHYQGFVNQDGNLMPTQDIVAAVLGPDAKSPPQLVLLCCCESVSIGDALYRAGVPLVMSCPIYGSDKWLPEFAYHFFSELFGEDTGSRRSAASAFVYARNAMVLLSDGSWLPLLTAHSLRLRVSRHLDKGLRTALGVPKMLAGGKPGSGTARGMRLRPVVTVPKHATRHTTLYKDDFDAAGKALQESSSLWVCRLAAQSKLALLNFRAEPPRDLAPRDQAARLEELRSTASRAAKWFDDHREAHFAGALHTLLATLDNAYAELEGSGDGDGAGSAVIRPPVALSRLYPFVEHLWLQAETEKRPTPAAYEKIISVLDDAERLYASGNKLLRPTTHLREVLNAAVEESKSSPVPAPTLPGAPRTPPSSPPPAGAEETKTPDEDCDHDRLFFQVQVLLMRGANPNARVLDDGRSSLLLVEHAHNHGLHGAVEAFFRTADEGYWEEPLDVELTLSTGELVSSLRPPTTSPRPPPLSVASPVERLVRRQTSSDLKLGNESPALSTVLSTTAGTSTGSDSPTPRSWQQEVAEATAEEERQEKYRKLQQRREALLKELYDTQRRMRMVATLHAEPPTNAAPPTNTAGVPVAPQGNT